MMIFILMKDKASYFQTYKNYFVSIYLIFLGFPIGDLILITSSSSTLQRISIQAVVTSGTLIAIIWGYVATKLYVYPETFSAKRLVSKPFRPIFFIFTLYLLPMLVALVDAWTDSRAISTALSSTIYPIDGITVPSTTVSTFLAGLGGAVVVAFTSYPLIVLSMRRALVKDREVRHALRLVATAFGMISAGLALGFGALAFGYNIVGPADVFSVVLIIVAVQAFRKPTFLKAFLGVVPSLQSSPNAALQDQMILIHGPNDDKFAPIGKYILDGANQRERVIFFHNGDVAEVTEGLSNQGIDTTKLMLKGALRIQPLGTAYPSKGVLDDTPIEVIQALSQEARTLGNEGLRVVLDYEDLIFHPLHNFVSHLTDPRWATADHRLHVLMAFSSSAFRGEEGSLAELEKKIRTLDLSETTDVFSETVGLSHTEIAGRKMLVEFDPRGNYENIFRSLLAESASNFERTVLFTRRDSQIYTLAERQPGTKVFVLTSRVSYPKMAGENLFLLPTYDTSLILDALNRTIEAYSGSSYTIIFDDISHLVFTIGPERTFAFVRQAMELMISDRITVIFSMNYQAHDPKIISTFENMFDIELVCPADNSPIGIKRKVPVLNSAY